jgi:glutaredoxin 3
MAKVVMYSKDYCPFCDRARSFFENREIQFTEIDLTGKEDEIQKIKNETGWRTVPIILIKDKLIGGYTDLKALAESGELDRILQAD